MQKKCFVPINDKMIGPSSSFFIKIILIFLTLINLQSTTYSQTYGNSFFVIHCDPKEPYNFPSLIKLVSLADSYKVPLTLEFTIPWLDTIKADIKKINLLKLWQKGGHEIAIHHHGITALSYWDGYTNYPQDSILARHWPLSNFKGTMTDFWMKMASLGGDEAIVTMGNEDTNDWISAIKYKTYGTFLSDAFSNVTDVKISGKTVKQISHTYIGNLATVTNIIRDYTIFSKTKHVGVVHHVWNYVDDSIPTVTWLKFISGKSCKTVKQIMESSSTRIEYFNETDKFPEDGINVFPNPSSGNSVNFFIKLKNLENPKIYIYDILGREVYHKNHFSANVVFQGGIKFEQRLSKGVYFIRFIGEKNNLLSKFIVK